MGKEMAIVGKINKNESPTSGKKRTVQMLILHADE